MLWQWKCTAALALTLCSALLPHPSPPCALHMLVLSPSCLFLIQRVQWQGMWGEPCFPSFLTTVVGQRSTFSSQQHTFPYIQFWNSVPQCWWLGSQGNHPPGWWQALLAASGGEFWKKRKTASPSSLSCTQIIVSDNYGAVCCHDLSVHIAQSWLQRVELCSERCASSARTGKTQILLQSCPLCGKVKAF